MTPGKSECDQTEFFLPPGMREFISFKKAFSQCIFIKYKSSESVGSRRSRILSNPQAALLPNMT